MRHSYHDAKTGAEVTQSIALDANGSVRDGFFMRNKFMMMDGVRVPVVDGARGDRLSLVDGKSDVIDAQAKSDAIDERNRRLSDAWRNPTPVLPVKQQEQEQQRTYTGDRAGYDERIAEAWRS